MSKDMDEIIRKKQIKLEQDRGIRKLNNKKNNNLSE